MTEQITARQFHADPSLAEWRVIGDGACTFFRTRSFVESARLIQAISELPGLENHTPDVDLR
jgi:4a-hydroxytetrahydrobiopterin dehydratase